MKGYIYAFIDNDTYEIYIGSTINSIKVRYGKHMTDLRMYLGLTKCGFRNYRSSFQILCNSNYKIVCIHEFDRIDKKDLKLFESMYIIKFKQQGLKIINSCISNRQARIFDYRNFGLNELDFSRPSLFPPSPLIA
tara:strand:+ start:1607 stop:2011 length:405 start_codon:yes stop_codon:yes gene_type:complete